MSESLKGATAEPFFFDETGLIVVSKELSRRQTVETRVLSSFSIAARIIRNARLYAEEQGLTKEEIDQLFKNASGE